MKKKVGFTFLGVSLAHYFGLFKIFSLMFFDNILMFSFGVYEFKLANILLIVGIGLLTWHYKILERLFQWIENIF